MTALSTFVKTLSRKLSMLDYAHSPTSSKVATSQYLPTLFITLKRVVPQHSCSNMCMSLEVVSGGGGGREEDKFLP